MMGAWSRKRNWIWRRELRRTESCKLEIAIYIGDVGSCCFLLLHSASDSEVYKKHEVMRSKAGAPDGIHHDNRAIKWDFSLKLGFNSCKVPRMGVDVIWIFTFLINFMKCTCFMFGIHE